MGYLYKDQWSEHPILSRIGYKSDFDGDGMLNLRDYDPSEFEDCQAITLEVSEDNGRTWKIARFDPEVIYIDAVGTGWPWLATGHPLDEFSPNTKELNKAIWRASISD